MNYLVMECGLGYAIVLDNQGRFIKVANMGYETGQTIEHIIILERPETLSFRAKAASFIAAAACLCLVVFNTWYLWTAPYGTIRMQINPEVQITSNCFRYVVGLENLNDDGKLLIQNYSYSGKSLKEVSEELSDLALEKGFLKAGGQISLTVDSKHNRWKTATETRLQTDIVNHLKDKAEVHVVVKSGPDRSGSTGSGIRPPESSPDAAAAFSGLDSEETSHSSQHNEYSSSAGTDEDLEDDDDPDGDEYDLDKEVNEENAVEQDDEDEQDEHESADEEKDRDNGQDRKDGRDYVDDFDDEDGQDRENSRDNDDDTDDEDGQDTEDSHDNDDGTDDEDGQDHKDQHDYDDDFDDKDGQDREDPHDNDDDTDDEDGQDREDPHDQDDDTDDEDGQDREDPHDQDDDTGDEDGQDTEDSQDSDDDTDDEDGQDTDDDSDE